MQVEKIDVEMLAYITVVRDGDDLKKRGKFMGLYGIPPQGGRYWFADNGKEGECETDKEARAAIQKEWASVEEVK